MKKRLWILAVVVMLVTLMAAPASLAMTHRAYVKNPSGLNIRTGPTKEASVAKLMPYGAEFVIIGDYDDGTWISVNYKGWEGFAMKRYMTYDKPGPKPTPKPTHKPTAKPTARPSDTAVKEAMAALNHGFVFVTPYKVEVCPSVPGNNVHMRWAATKYSNIMMNFHQGDVLEVLAQSKTWCQVRDPLTGTTGFMMRNFLSNISTTGDGAVSGS